MGDQATEIGWKLAGQGSELRVIKRGRKRYFGWEEREMRGKMGEGERKQWKK